MNEKEKLKYFYYFIIFFFLIVLCFLLFFYFNPRLSNNSLELKLDSEKLIENELSFSFTVTNYGPENKTLFYEIVNNNITLKKINFSLASDSSRAFNESISLDSINSNKTIQIRLYDSNTENKFQSIHFFVNQ